MLLFVVLENCVFKQFKQYLKLGIKSNTCINRDSYHKLRINSD